MSAVELRRGVISVKGSENSLSVRRRFEDGIKGRIRGLTLVSRDFSERKR